MSSPSPAQIARASVNAAEISAAESGAPTAGGGAATDAVRALSLSMIVTVPVPLAIRTLDGLTLPGAIVVATVAPLAMKGGLAGLAGITVAFAAMILRRNEFLAVALGLASIALARNFGF